MDGITVESEPATTTTTTATRQCCGTHRCPTTARSRSEGYPSVNCQHSDRATQRTTAPRTPVDALHIPNQLPLQRWRKPGRLRSSAHERSYHRGRLACYLHLAGDCTRLLSSQRLLLRPKASGHPASRSVRFHSVLNFIRPR